MLLNANQKTRLHTRSTKPRTSFKDGYSPAFAARKSFLYFYSDLIRHFFSSRRTHPLPWTGATYSTTLITCLDQWTTRFSSLYPTNDNLLDIPHPRHLFLMSFYSITLPYLQSLCTRIKASIHGRQRKKLRAATNSSIRKLDSLHEKHQLGDVIAQLSGNPSSHLDLHALPCKERGLITDPQEIQSALTAYFTDWYAVPVTLDPLAQRISDPSYQLVGKLTREPLDSTK